MEDQQKV